MTKTEKMGKIIVSIIASLGLLFTGLIPLTIDKAEWSNIEIVVMGIVMPCVIVFVTIPIVNWVIWKQEKWDK